MMDRLAKELTLDMIDGDGLYRQIAESIGIDNFYELAKIVGGSTFYIPKPESIVRPVRDAHIKAEFNGYNHLDLATKYGVSVRWVRHLCGAGWMQGQMDLEELLGTPV